ncbi:MAG TPA: CAP domain-containing protein [Phycisphaerae bacterium]|nr:CAP domain-containing protein [Phycisphaerae bacterium]HRY67010.1 CAP domain-containing protein [Phycisphaerae bacterium]HSA28849.1 CAP domain-containing protein [Phycisphaerae bacterium]
MSTRPTTIDRRGNVYRAVNGQPYLAAMLGLAVAGGLLGCGGPVSLFPGLDALTNGDLVGPVQNTTQVAGDTPLPACVNNGQARTAIHAELFAELNQYRAGLGLNPLIYSKTLEAAADDQVQDLFERSFFAHVNPDGEDPGARAVRAGFCHKYVGENLAAGQVTVLQVMQAWKDSPTHHLNMIDPDYVYVGIGYYVDPFGRRYWAQEFGFDLP